MPLALNKARTNSGDIAGDDEISNGLAKAIQLAYANCILQCTEMQENGWLTEPEAIKFLERQEALCAQFEGDYAEHHKHQQQHLIEMRRLATDERLWVDKKLRAKAGSKP